MLIKDNQRSIEITICYVFINKSGEKKTANDDRQKNFFLTDQSFHSFHPTDRRIMATNGTNSTLVNSGAPVAQSFLNTIQLVTSALTPCLELARIILSIMTFLLVHYSPLYRTTSFGLHMRCLAIYDSCRIVERLIYWFPPLTLFMPK